MTSSLDDWVPITELKAGCAICDNLKHNCPGNPEGTPCDRYVCRRDAGRQCIDCLYFRPFNNLTHSESGICTTHSEIVDSKDFCCYAFWGKRY